MTLALNALIVDDEANIRFFLAEVLESMNLSVDVSASGEEALDILQSTFFDLIMLDLSLSGQIDGMRVLEMAKWRWPETIVIILTAHGSLDSAVKAIREGVDGYLLKPAEPTEIRQTIKTVLTRKRQAQRAPQEVPFTVGRFQIDLREHTITFDGKPLQLTPTDFTLLTYFARNPNRVIKPQELVEEVRGNIIPSDEPRKFASWHVHKLRKIIEPDPSNPQFLINVRGVGYRFVV